MKIKISELDTLEPYEHFISLYHSHLLVVFNEKAMEKLENEYAFPSMYFPKPGCAATRSFSKETANMVVVLFNLSPEELKDIPGVAALVAHESIHATDLIFDFLGETTKTVELHAYLLQYITERIMSLIYRS